MNVYRSVAYVVLIALSIVSFAISSPASEPDASNCADHPLFTRMQNMHIVTCKTVEFDQYVFKTGKTSTTVEGKRTDIKYRTDSGSPAPSALAIIRNYQQAVKKIGGEMLYEDQRYTTLKISRDGKEVWAQIDTAWNQGYMVNIVEKQAMVQEVVANAESFKAGLADAGHVELQGVFFDTGKAELKPESEAALKEVAKMLQQSADLKVWVVGHTDYVGTAESNLALSTARAASVVKYLTANLGIDAKRLGSFGAGPYAPIAPNSTEEGRAKNRRVELVVQP